MTACPRLNFWRGDRGPPSCASYRQPTLPENSLVFIFYSDLDEEFFSGEAGKGLRDAVIDEESTSGTHDTLCRRHVSLLIQSWKFRNA